MNWIIMSHGLHYKKYLFHKLSTSLSISCMVTDINAHYADGKRIQVLLNVGGPDRVSRLQMAESVADVRGYSHSTIKSVSASSVLSSLSWTIYRHGLL